MAENGPRFDPYWQGLTIMVAFGAGCLAAGWKVAAATVIVASAGAAGLLSYVRWRRWNGGPR